EPVKRSLSKLRFVVETGPGVDRNRGGVGLCEHDRPVDISANVGAVEVKGDVNRRVALQNVAEVRACVAATRTVSDGTVVRPDEAHITAVANPMEIPDIPIHAGLRCIPRRQLETSTAWWVQGSGVEKPASHVPC